MRSGSKPAISDEQFAERNRIIEESGGIDAYVEAIRRTREGGRDTRELEELLRPLNEWVEKVGGEEVVTREIVLQQQWRYPKPEIRLLPEVLQAIHPFSLPQPLEHQDLGFRITLDRAQNPDGSSQVLVKVTNFEDEPLEKIVVTGHIMWPFDRGMILEDETDSEGKIELQFPTYEDTNNLNMTVGEMSMEAFSEAMG